MYVTNQLARQFLCEILYTINVAKNFGGKKIWRIKTIGSLAEKFLAT